MQICSRTAGEFSAFDVTHTASILLSDLFTFKVLRKKKSIYYGFLDRTPLKLLIYARRFLNSFSRYNKLLKRVVSDNCMLNKLQYRDLFFKAPHFNFIGTQTRVNNVNPLFNLLKVNASGLTDGFLVEDFSVNNKVISVLLRVGAGLRHTEFFFLGVKNLQIDVALQPNLRFLSPLRHLDSQELVNNGTFNVAFFDSLSDFALGSNFTLGVAALGETLLTTPIPS